MQSTPYTSFGSEQWYVVSCKHRKEMYTASLLRRHLGLVTFLPEIIRGTYRFPFFPGYLFVYVDLQKVCISLINTSPGVLHILEFGNGPQLIPHQTIEMIQGKINELNVADGLPGQKFCSGDSVRVKSGPLQSLEAVFVGPITPSKRVYVLLHFLGGLNQVQVDVSTIERISSNSDKQHERYTRGQGRRINSSK